MANVNTPNVPPYNNAVTGPNNMLTSPWLRWVNALFSFLQFPTILVGTNAYTTETTGVNINGVNTPGTSMISDMGQGAPIDQLLLHKHSTTKEPIIQTVRSNSDGQPHVPVTAGMVLFSHWSGGTTGSGATLNYKQFGGWQFIADPAGTISGTSAPGKWVLSVTPNGSVTPVAAITVGNTGAIQPGHATPNAYLSSDASPGITTTITTAGLVGKTITVKDGLITGFA